MQATCEVKRPPGSAAARDTSAEAFYGLSNKFRESLQGRLLAVLAQRHGYGVRDMSMRELREAFFQAHQQWIDMSSISSSCNGLVKAGRLERLSEPRECAITGRDITPLRAVLRQADLVS